MRWQRGGVADSPRPLAQGPEEMALSRWGVGPQTSSWGRRGFPTTRVTPNCISVTHSDCGPRGIYAVSCREPVSPSWPSAWIEALSIISMFVCLFWLALCLK